MASVKDLLVEEAPDDGTPGRGAFRFSDDYSVFDWGRMPDAIPGKGASLCAMGAHNFELLEAEGVPTHYRGVIEDGETVGLAEVADPPQEMAIDLTQVPDLPHEGDTYDYDAYHDAGGANYLVPLEVVFRNVVPVGSSLRDRSEPGDHGLPHEEWPEGAVDLEEPVVEFSTKYEEQDRYLDRAEADRIAGAADLGELERLAREVNRVVTERAREAGLVHQDGKIECLYHDGELRVADVVGTFDENRFSYAGQQVSKEVLRQYYKREHPEWAAAVSDAKAAARERGVADWRTLCAVEPPALPGDVIEAAGDLYAAGANAYVGRDLLEAPPIGEAVDRVRAL
ncbi:MAG: phosphoribosylaminoimidazolesuccinocarboxamide synthase [Halobacteriales archaeon]